MRTCTTCKQDKQEFDFYIRKYGNLNVCKQCVRQRVKENSSRNRVQRNAKTKEWNDKQRALRNSVILPTEKKCSRCEITKPTAEFYRALSLDGLKAYCRACARYERKSARQSVKLECFQAYGGLHCAICQEDDQHVLQLDHINNDGAEHRRSFKGNGRIGGDRVYLALKKNGFPPGFQVLCANCNMAKALNGGKNPEWRRQSLIS